MNEGPLSGTLGLVISSTVSSQNRVSDFFHNFFYDITLSGAFPSAASDCFALKETQQTLLRNTCAWKDLSF